MKQAQVSATSTWVGNPQGGVSAPDPVLLPNPSFRFKNTATRLEKLGEGHPMAEWLGFLAQLSRAQHKAATLDVTAPPAPDLVAAATASDAGMPPLAADGHTRDPAWIEALNAIVRHFDRETTSSELVAGVLDSLRDASPDTLEALADNFLRGSIEPADAGRAVFIAAALQVYFTRLAAQLDVKRVHLLPERGLCPCCGSTPVASLVTASGGTPGARYLYCSLCSTAWNHVRATCITCGDASKVSLKSIEGGDDAVRAETCDSCHTYSKSLYLGKDTAMDPYADDLASLDLDLMVADAGWSRHAPNPLLLVS